MPSIQEDLSNLLSSEPRKIDILKYFLSNPGFRAVVLYRLQQKNFNSGRFRKAIIFNTFNQVLNGIEISLGCEIGKCLVIRHPTGIVLGERVKIGDFAILQHGVTVGLVSSKSTNFAEYPIIGNSVTIGTHAVILGNVAIGNNVTIGALTLIRESIPDNCTVVGIPGKVIS